MEIAFAKKNFPLPSHRHGALRCRGPWKCKNGYPRSFRERTCVDAQGYVQHRRTRTERIPPNSKSSNAGLYYSQVLVPHNLDLLILADCHINVEFAFTVNVIPYLYKYIFKGPDHVQVAVHTNDEIKDYQYSRYISSSEASYRFLGYHIHPRRDPAVAGLPVHDPENAYISFRLDSRGRVGRAGATAGPASGAGASDDGGSDMDADMLELAEAHGMDGDGLGDSGERATRSATAAAAVPERYLLKKTPLEKYLLRPREALDKSGRMVDVASMTYVDFYNSFDFVERHKEGKTVHAMSFSDLYVKARDKLKVHRMHVKTPRAGEVYYIRRLLSDIPSPVLRVEDRNDARNDRELLQRAWSMYRSPEETFQAAALAKGLLAGNNEYEQMFADALEESWTHGRVARQLFVAVVLEGASSVNLRRKYLDDPEQGKPLWQDFYSRMYAPGQDPSSTVEHRCRQAALADISDRFKAAGMCAQSLERASLTVLAGRVVQQRFWLA